MTNLNLNQNNIAASYQSIVVIRTSMVLIRHIHTGPKSSVSHNNHYKCIFSFLIIYFKVIILIVFYFLECGNFLGVIKLAPVTHAIFSLAYAIIIVIS